MDTPLNFSGHSETSLKISFSTSMHPTDNKNWQTIAYVSMFTNY
jgi:hypothetical protein